MPVINLDFTNVESYDNLPLGKYAGNIEKVELRPATDPSKFDQFMATYLVTDGDLVGRKSSEFLSLSPKAAFRLKKWFDNFGISDALVTLDIDDDTNLLLEPDLVGYDVIFEVYEDPKLYQGEKQVRTRLLEVLDAEEEEPAPPPPPARRAASRARPAPAPVVEEEELEEEEEEAPAPVAVARRRPAQPAAAAGPARRKLT